MMPCDLNQFTQDHHSQTSSGISSNVIVDRDSGQLIEIQQSSFNLRMSEESLPFTTSRQTLSQSKVALLIKCLIIIQALSEVALEETSMKFDRVFGSYNNYPSQPVSPKIPENIVQIELETLKTESSRIVETNTQLRPFGLCRGEFTVPDDFDSPLPEHCLNAFEGA